MTLDKATREAIAAVIEKKMTEKMEMYDEQWVSGKELCERISMFTPQWLKVYGSSLPRERMTFSVDGKTKHSHWCYPLHRIQRWIQEERGHQSIII